MPLILFTKAEESIWYALSLATIGGLLSSTLLVLLVIPVGLCGTGEIWKIEGGQNVIRHFFKHCVIFARLAVSDVFARR